MPKRSKISLEIDESKTRKRFRGKSSLLLQLAAMVEWLEMKENFDLLTGKATSGLKSIQAGAKLTKEMGYSDLAQFVNFNCGAEWTSTYAESRFRAFVKKYKSTKRALLDPSSKKFCLGQDDYDKGIRTIEAKLEKECPNFTRMDTLFVSHQIVASDYDDYDGDSSAEIKEYMQHLL